MDCFLSCKKHVEVKLRIKFDISFFFLPKILKAYYISSLRLTKMLILHKNLF